MALGPLIKSLPKSAARALPFIRRGVREGLSNQAILRGLRGAGMGIRVDNINVIVRELKGIQLATKQLKNVGKSKMPDWNKLKQSITPIGRSYSFIHKVEGTIGGTDQRFTRYVTLSTDDKMTREAMEQFVIDNILDDNIYSDLEVDSVELEEGIRRADSFVT